VVEEFFPLLLILVEENVNPYSRVFDEKCFKKVVFNQSQKFYTQHIDTTSISVSTYYIGAKQTHNATLRDYA
jgi:hypothetical protein